MSATKRAAVAFVVIVCGLIAYACRPPHVPALLTCPAGEGAFTQQTRLAAMLSVHAFAYFPTSVSIAGHGPDGLVVEPLADAIGILRCDPDPLAVSRRRRAIAKLLAYDWPGVRYRAALQALGADVDAIVADIQSEEKHARLHQYLLHNRAFLEVLILRLTARKPFIVVTYPGSLFPPTMTPPPPTVTSTAPTVTPTPPPGPPTPATVTPTATPTPTMMIMPAPVNVCAKGWIPEMVPYARDSGTVIDAYAYISVPDLVRDDVAKNVDPQSWDECSKFWPKRPPSGPYDSASLATVSSPDCVVTLPEVSLTTLPAGSVYPAHKFYEYFRCVTPPCDSEFQNILTVATSYRPRDIGGSTVDAYHVHYSLPVCWSSLIDGAIWGRIEGQLASPIVDEGTLDVWEGGGKTYIQSDKHVAFTSKTYTATLGELLSFTELNEELAEVACCRKGKSP